MQLVNSSPIECNKIIKSLIKTSEYVQISLHKKIYMLFGTWRVPYIVPKLIWTFLNMHNIVQKRNAQQSTIELRLTQKQKTKQNKNKTFPLLCVWITKLWPILVLNLHHLLLKLMFSSCIIHISIIKKKLLLIPRKLTCTQNIQSRRRETAQRWRMKSLFDF